jgi:thioredoxin 1
MIGPMIDELAETYSGRIKIGKIDVDVEADLAGRHGISSIPTLVIYHKGQVVRQQVGALPKQGIEALFTDLI